MLNTCFFVDLLAPCIILLKVMQFDNLDILSTLNSFIKSVKEIGKLSLLPLPVYTATMLKCTEINGSVCYQSQNLK